MATTTSTINPKKDNNNKAEEDNTNTYDDGNDKSNDYINNAWLQYTQPSQLDKTINQQILYKK